MLDKEHVEEVGRVLNGVDTGRDQFVSDSWQRCVEAYGMDPAHRQPAHILSDSAFREHREQSERLIATARSGLQSLFGQVAGQNYILLLADAEGVCVDFFGDRSFEEELRSAGLYLGFKWTEELAGTNGVGSCLVTGQPVTVHQSDHFSVSHTPLSCTAAPIFDTKGSLAAVLDVSLLRGPLPKTSQNLAMSLVTSATRRVEMANLMASTRRDWVLRFSSSPEFLDVDPEAAIALDGSGRIVGMTAGARRALDPSERGHVIGSRLDDWLEIRVDDLPDYMRGRPTEDRVLHLKDGRALFGHAIAPQTPQVTSMLRDREDVLPGALGSFAGSDTALQALLGKVARVARTQVPLLLSGETGTGKERLARSIHMSGAKAGPFHMFRCLKGIPLRSLRTVAPGTLFLRGLDDLQPEDQPELLSLIEDRPDLRLIASCSCNLEVLRKRLRADLFHRITGASFALPALRYRADVDWLIDRILRRSATEDVQLSPAARAELQSRPWPGNIRELEHTLVTAVALCEDSIIDLPDLPAVPCKEEGDVSDDLEALLVACGWNMSLAARRLGVNRSTVLRRAKKAGLHPPD